MSGVLIVDDNEDILIAARLLLKPLTTVATETDPNKITGLMEQQDFDVIFLDMNFTEDKTSGQEGFYWLKEILKIDPMAVVILITAYGGVETAVRAVKEGATDFVLKPWHNEKLVATYYSALKLRESRLELNRIRDRQKFLNEDYSTGFCDIIGTSDAMKRVFNTISKVGNTDANVLILGENGTGKELIARSLHKMSQRADEVFVSVDMGAISPTLFESELFGHMKGAFTDAREDRPGRFEIASGGTLFLDEIGNLPYELQSKLLSVLQNRQVMRIGSHTFKPIDIRLICATNMPLSRMIPESKFRQDLLYRINTIEIKIPPLRERRSDIPLLTEYYFTIFKKKYNKPELQINPVTLTKLEHHDWPGNVRELQHAIERAVILCETDTLQPHDFFFSEERQKEENGFDNYNLDEVEKTIIRKILQKYEGNVTKAAKELGLTRTSLYRRIEKHGL